MNYCVEEKGMNQPLTIQPDQVKTKPAPEQPGDINPTSPTSGLDFPTPNPQINITLDQPSTLTVIFTPVDRPNQPTSNVEQFTVVFTYPDGTTSPIYYSEIPASTKPSETTTTPSTTTGVFPPSPNAPQVDLPPNFKVPEDTVVTITIISTKDKENPRDVCVITFSFFIK
jgi:hypothetical protein